MLDGGFDSSDMRLWHGEDSRLGPGITTGLAAPTLQMSYSTEAGPWSAWFDWTIGVLPECRYVKPRLKVSAAVGKMFVSRFKATIDEEISIKTGQDVAVGSGGLSITFARQFHTVPVVKPIAKDAAQIAIPSNVTSLGFDVAVFDVTTGLQTSGVIDWEARGV